MPQTAIFAPFFAMMALTLIVWLYMYSRRIPFIIGQRFDPKSLAIPGELARRSPPEVSNPSDNLKNLFEIPVLFYAVAIYLYVTQRVDGLNLTAAWVFVAFRALHSLVHCTSNVVLLRFYMYLVSTVALWFVVIREAVRYFDG